MSVLAGLSSALLLAIQVGTPSSLPDTALAGGSVPPVTVAPARIDSQATLLAIRPAGLQLVSRPAASQDTVPRKRAKAVVYSDAYGKRLTIHKTLSWAMLPLFAVSYVSGDQLIKKSGDAPEWARTIHPIAATSTAVLFGANTITGGWNLWESRHDANGRTRRYLHSILFLAASGGFAYTGTKLAEDAQERQSQRNVHRNGALISMGMSTASWLIMLVGN